VEVIVFVGVFCVSVNVGDGVSLLTGAMGVMRAASYVSVNGSVRIIGVGLTIPGVRDGMGDQTGKGCGCTLKVSHAARRRRIREEVMIFFIVRLYSGGKLPVLSNLPPEQIKNLELFA
jgi:hypothetical protein